MRCMKRNKRKFYYSLYEGTEKVIDEFGNETGEDIIIRGKPQEYSANISAASGETQTRQFGENVIYDRVIVMDKTAPPIDEYSVLWVDTKPKLNQDGTTNTPYDYIIKAVARSLNVVSIAISKVNVND